MNEFFKVLAVCTALVLFFMFVWVCTMGAIGLHAYVGHETGYW